ncbi:hypothetical protein AGMMS49992_07760 [Clostridia bacterium]|nr:hypothetical protein AGMMS49992_07760 [Clostridia bacterium]
MPWRISAQAAIWRKGLLERSIEPSYSPWMWEAYSTARAKSWKEQLYITPCEMMKYPKSGALLQGRWQESVVKKLRANDISLNFSRRGVIKG